jgi:hypothetical protein
MKYFLPSFFVFVFLTSQVNAQEDLFGTKETESPARKGFILGFNGNFDFPAGDMADRFGLSYRIGPSVLYKTKSNWMFGAKADFIFGGKVKEDSLLSNVQDKNGSFIGANGMRVSIDRLERGYLIGLQAGKIISISKKNPDNGILLLTSAGFLQHKILITNKDGSVVQLRGDYRKGYDRLTNGFFLEQFVGYNSFDRNGFLNFHIGLDILAGFTKGRRDFLYDVRRPDNESRVDILFGIRGGWYIPIFKRKSEEIFFQ